MPDHTHLRPGSLPSDLRAFSHAGGRGFSMVELAIVMVIVGVVAAIATPRYAAARAQYRVQNAAQRVAADYAGLRPTAYSQSGPCTFIASAGADSYSLSITTRDSSDMVRTITESVNLGIEPYKASFVTVSLTSGTAIGFDAYGNSLGSGGVQLRSSWTLTSVSFAPTGDVTVSAPVAMTPGQRATLGAR